MLVRQWFASILLALALAPAANAAEADNKAIRQLIDDFVKALIAGDKQAMSQLYTTDARYFQVTGKEATGNKAIPELILGGPAPQPGQAPPPPPKIFTDQVDSDGTLGYAFGRVCAPDSDGKSGCGSRWLVVTRKGADGKWRMQADIDTKRNPDQTK